MGKKLFVIGLFIPLLLAGLLSIAVHKGLVYGIDFRGGTEVTVKFAKDPDLDGIRKQLDQQNLRGATLQQIGAQADHEVIIGLDLKTTTSSDALDAGKQAIINALGGLYGAGPPGKADFNNSSPQSLLERLIATDPLQLAFKGSEAADKGYHDLADT